MRVAVMGAGAVGCYYGVLLAIAGHDVTLIARPLHAEAINREGLKLERKGAIEHVRLTAHEDPAAVSGAALVLFCVKSTDTLSAGAAMAPHLADSTTILSLQNGVDNAPRLETLLGRAVIPTIVYVACDMPGPGHVRHRGRGDLILGPGGPSSLPAMLNDAGIPTVISENIRGALWSKMIINCAYNALSAITGQPYGQLVQVPGMKAVIADIVHECLAVTEKLGVTLPAPIWPAVEQIAVSMATQISSTAQDLARGKPTEIEHLNGYITRQGVPAPVNQTMYALVKAKESLVL